MDLVFPLPTRYVSPKPKNCSSTNAPTLRALVQGSRKNPKNVRVRSEFDAKLNGALSAEFDPRFIDRQKALEAAMNDINSSFGKGSVTRLGSAGGALVETFPSGCLTLDFALGGGLPKGRIVEIYGPESSGKTTLALHAIAEVQRLGGNAMLVDAEHAFDPSYSKSLGVDVENLIVCQPDNGEMAIETLMVHGSTIRTEVRATSISKILPLGRPPPKAKSIIRQPLRNVSRLRALPLFHCYCFVEEVNRNVPQCKSSPANS